MVIDYGSNVATKKTNNILVQPKEKTGLVKNPAMGWVIYIDAFSGFPNAEEYWREMDMYCAKASIIYIRLPWSQLEPQEGLYSWIYDENYIKLINMALQRNLKLAFRVYVDSRDSYMQATPMYVKESGCNGYIINPGNGEHNTFWTPFLFDTIFQKSFEKFITEFAKEYDNADIVDFIDAGGLGWWGEMHNVDYLDKKQRVDIYNWITLLYKSNFKNILLGDQYGLNSFPIELHDNILNDGWIIRRDSFGSPIWFDQKEKDMVKSKWPKTAVFAENCYHTLTSRSSWWSGDGFKTLKDCLSQVIKDAEECHANTLDLRIIEDAKAWNENAPDLIDYFANICGYRFVLEEVHFTEKDSVSLNVHHVWKNSGIGKLPNDSSNWNNKYKVAFMLQSCSTCYVIVEQSIILDSWIKGNTYKYDTSIEISEYKKGSYSFYVGIVDVSKEVLKPAINLAIDLPKNDEGWYFLDSVFIED